MGHGRDPAAKFEVFQKPAHGCAVANQTRAAALHPFLGGRGSNVIGFLAASTLSLSNTLQALGPTAGLADQRLSLSWS